MTRSYYANELSDRTLRRCPFCKPSESETEKQPGAKKPKSTETQEAISEATRIRQVESRCRLDWTCHLQLVEERDSVHPRIEMRKKSLREIPEWLFSTDKFLT